jgi:hypothetical protein
MLFLTSGFCGGGNDHVSKDKLINDIDYLAKVINEAHGDPYRIISRQRFEKKIKELKHHIRSLKTDKIPIIDCFFFLQELTALIQDGHTSISFPFQNLENSDLLFPFALKVIDERVFIVKKLEENRVPLFSEILEINNIPIKTLMSESYKLFNTSLEHGRSIFFEFFFQLYLPTYFDLPSPWVVTYKSDSQIREAEVKGVAANQYLTFFQRDSRYKEFSFTVDEEVIPGLDIPSFAHGSQGEYKNFIDTFFEKHKKANYLVIDLRENLGGNGIWGYYLMDYLIDSPYRIRESFDFKVSDILRYSQYSNKAGKKLKTAKNGIYLPIEMAEIRKPHRIANKFRGRVFLLISQYTFSAGVVTAAIFKFNKMGTVIGQETVGKERFCSDPVRVTLPQTKLEVIIPLAIYTLPGDNPDRGVIPDILTVYSIEDYQNHKDKEFDKVRELIKTGKIENRQ